MTNVSSYRLGHVGSHLVHQPLPASVFTIRAQMSRHIPCQGQFSGKSSTPPCPPLSQLNWLKDFKALRSKCPVV